MITEFMTLNSYSDAVVWAQQMGLPNEASEDAVAEYLWENKPAIGCTLGEFRDANPNHESDIWALCSE